MVSIHLPTKRIVWMHSWKDWPRLVPLTHEMRVARIDWSPTDLDLAAFESFSLEMTNHRPRIVDLTIADVDFRLMNKKCTAVWNFLNHLYLLQRSVQGYLPGMLIGGSDLIDRTFSENENQAMAQFISTELDRYHDRLWLADSIDELRSITTEMILRYKKVPTLI